MPQEIFDEELVRGCLNNNPHYQRLLYKRFAGKMLTVCLRYGISREEAEDILHEGFIIVFKKLYQFRMDGSFEGWIRKIMVNKSIEHFKKASRMFPVVDIDEVNEDLAGPEEILSGIGWKDLLQMVQELPPMYRMVFNLYVFEKMTHYEIAKHLGVAEGTSKSNLFDARNLLKKKIQNSLLVARKKAT